ncbi:hypothetical protein LLE49_21865 [Alicyclobacillus tolerans]|uniref:hypothetical protein n=1 Tax=Alicyclobacillus tolerans TaxID=90970 RepID=UPI001F367165|nr:hypothetical protein [Alicyclobacillus tolerans]MCF8567372.1 hypothetical protein [Alicyclobacillus tolerans]
MNEVREKRNFQKNYLWVLIGMFVVFVILAIWGVNKISRSMSVNVQSAPASVQNTGSVRDTVIQLPGNRIGIINGNPVYGAQMHTIMIFQYDVKTDKFKLIGSFDYYKYINNPSAYGIQTDTNSQ